MRKYSSLNFELTYIKQITVQISFGWWTFELYSFWPIDIICKKRTYKVEYAVDWLHKRYLIYVPALSLIWLNII